MFKLYFVDEQQNNTKLNFYYEKHILIFFYASVFSLNFHEQLSYNNIYIYMVEIHYVYNVKCLITHE